MNQKPKLRKVGGSKKVIELPEELTGRQLASWVRKKQIPLFRRKMRRTKVDPEAERINQRLELQRKPMRRLKRLIKPVVFTRVRKNK
jgi:hypothetical protein